MSVTEPTPLHPRSAFHRAVAEILEGDQDTAAAVTQIGAAHDTEVRALDAKLRSLQRSEADAHAQHWTSWRMLEFVQSTMSAQLRRAAVLHARCEQQASMLANIRHLLAEAHANGRPIRADDLGACLAAMDPTPVLPQQTLAIVPDHSYASGVFEGNADGAPVEYRFPYYGVALVTTATEPERITEPCFMVGERVLSATAIGQQLGVTLRTYE